MGWQKWKYASGVLYDKKMSVGLKGKVYCMIVRSAVLYGSECLAYKKDISSKVDGSRGEYD